MNDQKFKSILGFIAENKHQLCQYLDYLQPSDLQHGILSIPETLVNEECKKLVLPRLTPYLKDYKVSFCNDYIFLDLNLNIKQLGMLKGMYMLNIQDFVYEPNEHHISFSYREDIRSQGNAMQAMMLKTFLLNQGTLLQKAVGLFKSNAITATRSNVAIDLNAFPIFTSTFLNDLHIEFQQCQDGKFTCNFAFVN